MKNFKHLSSKTIAQCLTIGLAAGVITSFWGPKFMVYVIVGFLIAKALPKVS